MRTPILRLIIGLIALSWFHNSYADVPVTMSGEYKKWHAVTLSFEGPESSETASPNPFVDYRFNVQFTHKSSGKQYLIPGYFAADGDAANTQASSGKQWRVHFSPDETGTWEWQADFRKGHFVAISKDPKAGRSGHYMDRQRGQFTIKKSNKRYPDFRARGRLSYVDQPYLRFEETGEYFIKSGPDSPENLLAYQDFDGSFHTDGHGDEWVKSWQPHEQDWRRGDPQWQGGKGRGLIGALNYIASKGLNSVSFLTLNIKGDDKNVFPYIDYETHDRFDVSKLAQWQIIFDHAQQQGLFLHVKTQEVENQGLLDGGGVGLQRKLYYRELIARFGYHLALNWNLGEENGEWHHQHKTPPQTTSQRLAMAQYFYENDPYHHHVVIHNGKSFDDLTGPNSRYTGVSLQTHKPDFSFIHPEVKRLRRWPVINGKPLAISVDEPGDAEYALVADSKNPDHTIARRNALWGALTAGAWGIEWYFGYKNAHSDLSAQDWRTRDAFWEQVSHALAFFKKIDVPYQEAANLDNISAPHWALGKPGEFYIVSVTDAKNDITLKLPRGKAHYSIEWFDPINGGDLQQGSKHQVSVDTEAGYRWQTTQVDLGQPPKTAQQDWVILVKRQD